MTALAIVISVSFFCATIFFEVVNENEVQKDLSYALNNITTSDIAQFSQVGEIFGLLLEKNYTQGFSTCNYVLTFDGETLSSTEFEVCSWIFIDSHYLEFKVDCLTFGECPRSTPSFECKRFQSNWVCPYVMMEDGGWYSIRSIDAMQYILNVSYNNWYHIIFMYMILIILSMLVGMFAACIYALAKMYVC